MKETLTLANLGSYWVFGALTLAMRLSLQSLNILELREMYGSIVFYYNED